MYVCLLGSVMYGLKEKFITHYVLLIESSLIVCLEVVWRRNGLNY